MGNLGIALLSVFLLAGDPQGSPLEATTADGKKVLLFRDGTWKYKEEPEQAPMEDGRKKPPAATEVVKSKKKFLEVWYDPKKWKVEAEPDGEAEIELEHTADDAWVMIIVERIPMPLATLRKIALENAKDAAPDARIVFEEERVVNGVKVLVLQIEATVQGMAFKYYGYYWAGKSGAVQVIAMTGQNLFSELERDLTDLLDGTMITGE